MPVTANLPASRPLPATRTLRGKTGGLLNLRDHTPGIREHRELRVIIISESNFGKCKVTSENATTQFGFYYLFSKYCYFIDPSLMASPLEGRVEEGVEDLHRLLVIDEAGGD